MRYVYLVMHIALRSPPHKEFYVDGKNVVPEVHHVLNKVIYIAHTHVRLSIFITSGQLILH
ncbi:hypothetical protein EON65_17195 [archaeon]|nr:MAG: hypothetical protein EON65_17195 [archaeon]